MSATVFYQGGNEFATIRNTFTLAGVATDPSAITLVTTDPQGAQITYTYLGSPNITRVSAGVYEVNQPCATSPGLWSYVWAGTGAAADVAAGTWRVFATTVGRLYTSVEEVKSRLGITDTADDFEVQLAVEAAANWIEGRCGRHFYQLTEVRTYVPDNPWVCFIDDTVSITSMVVDQNGLGVYDDVWTENTHYKLSVGLNRYNQRSSGEVRPYREVNVIATGKQLPFVFPLARMDRVKITGVFGWPAVPKAIEQAALLLSSDFFKLKDAPFGVAGTSDFGAIRVHGVSAQVMKLVSKYIDPRRKVAV